MLTGGSVQFVTVFSWCRPRDAWVSLVHPMRRRVSGVALIPWMTIEMVTQAMVVQTTFVVWACERLPVSATVERGDAADTEESEA